MKFIRVVFVILFRVFYFAIAAIYLAIRMAVFIKFLKVELQNFIPTTIPPRLRCHGADGGDQASAVDSLHKFGEADIGQIFATDLTPLPPANHGSPLPWISPI